MGKKAASLSQEPIIIWNLGLPYLLLGNYNQAIPLFKKSAKLWPDFLVVHIHLAAACSLAGRMEEARAEVAEVLRIKPQYSLEEIGKSSYFNFKSEDKELLREALRKAGLK